MIGDAFVSQERYSGGKTSFTTTISASGTTTLVTPPTGFKIRLVWVSIIPSSDNSAANLAQIGFASTGSLYRAYAVAHWEVFDGARGESLTITAATAEALAVTVHYRLVPA